MQIAVYIGRIADPDPEFSKNVDLDIKKTYLLI